MSYDYAGLIRVAGSVLQRPDIDMMAADWIYLVEQELTTVLHRREMAQLSTASTVIGQQAYALPTDFGEAIAMHVNQTGNPSVVLDPSEWDRLVLLYQDQTGKPQQWALVQNQFMVGPTPDAIYTLELYYYKSLPNLTGTATTNWLLTSYPKVYLYGVLAEAAVQFGDPRGKGWEAMFKKSVDVVINDQIRDRHLGGGPLLRTEWPIARGTFNINTGQFQ